MNAGISRLTLRGRLAKMPPDNPAAPYTAADVFGVLYENAHPHVFRYVFGLTGGPQQEVEDITAETFTRAWKARHSFQGSDDAALGWLLRIARNLVVDSRRRVDWQQPTQDVAQMVIAAPDATPEEQAILREQCAVLWSLLRDLPDDHREMLVLRYMLGWRVKRIGEYFDMPENTVSVTLRRLLKRLRDNWPQL